VGTRTRSRFVVAASAVVAVVLLVLTVVAVASVAEIRTSQRETEQLAARVTAWRDLQLAVAEEAFAEAGYRRAPSVLARGRLDDAIAVVPQRMDVVRDLGDARDATTLDRLAVLNERYVAEVRRSLDDSPVPGQDDLVAGPALDSMSDLLAESVRTHREHAAAARAAQASTAELVSWLVPSCTLVAVLALGLCWVTLVRRHRRLIVDAGASALRASQDPLTGLANRTSLRLEFDRRVAAGTPCALVLVDLDHFKAVNDTLGHQAGDALLVAVAGQMSDLVRAGDLVARLGGDEFALLLDDVAGTASVCRRLSAGVADLALAYDVPVGASTGSAAWPVDADRYDELVRLADARMYRSKRAGRAEPTTSPHDVEVVVAV
jgi:diguanylate cyclase (GGDEF)-like protein